MNPSQGAPAPQPGARGKGTGALSSSSGGLLFVFSLFAIFIVSTLVVRPLLPIDETRYLSVAWQMWLRGDFLVPHLNGEVYAQKPPLLFWLITLGWKILGVNDWWPRLVSPLIALANFFLVSRLARLLWPERPRLARSVPFCLLSLPLWTFFASLATFDMLLTFFTLVTQIGWLLGWRERRLAGFGIAALGIGGGILAKGPVILIHVIPVILFARVWARRSEGLEVSPDGVKSRGWPVLYSIGAIGTGTCLALAWAIPAGIAGGAAYQDQIFRSQTTGRVLNSFAHRQPFWWYLPLLPLFLFPWFFTRSFWRSPRKSRADEGMLFCAIWAGAALCALSLVSGKQVYYFLPELPAIALLVMRWLDARTPEPETPRFRFFPLGVLYCLLGIALACAPAFARRFHRAPEWVAASPGTAVVFGVLVILSGVCLVAIPSRKPARLAAISTIVVMTCCQCAVFIPARPYYDLSRISEKIFELQNAGREVAMVGDYHGQFGFLGRLKAPLRILASPEEALLWCKDHPSGILVTVCKRDRTLPGDLPFVQPYRAKLLALWPAAEAAARAPLFIGAQ